MRATQFTDAAEIFQPGWKKESRAGIAAPPVVGDGLFWKSHLFGICNDGCVQPLAGHADKEEGRWCRDWLPPTMSRVW